MLTLLKTITMLQTAFIRENREKVIQALGKRNFDAAPLVDEVIALDEKRRAYSGGARYCFVRIQ